MRAFSLILVGALILAGCRGEQARKDGQQPAQVESSTATASSMAQLKAEKQLMVNELNDVLNQLQSQGIEVRKTPKKHPWRLIVPALQKVSDPQARKQQAQQIATDFKAKLEPLMHKNIDVAVYATAKETEKLN